MHAQGDLGIPAVTAEMALADQNAHEQAPLDLGQMGLVSHGLNCFTVMKNVKRRWAPELSS
jgi:hypothetical protein